MSAKCKCEGVINTPVNPTSQPGKQALDEAYVSEITTTTYPKLKIITKTPHTVEEDNVTNICLPDPSALLRLSVKTNVCGHVRKRMPVNP